MFDNSSVFGLILFTFLILIAVAMVNIIYKTILSWRKLNSSPPSISLEKDGVKRGLTAVEAAVLMELPLDKVIQLILFGAIEKGAAEVTNPDPIKIRIVDGLIESLHHYEITFLKAFGADDTNSSQYLLSVGLASLIEYISEKMRGFKRQETINHYQSIVQDAWQEMKNADLPALKNIGLNNIPGWTNLLKQYSEGMRHSFGKSEFTSPVNDVLEAFATQVLDNNPKVPTDPIYKSKISD